MYRLQVTIPREAGVERGRRGDRGKRGEMGQKDENR
jgi:hypothetical protein